MTVTITYSLDFLQNLDLTGGPAAGEADAVALANGGFVAVGTAGGLTDLNVFAPNFSAAGSALNLPGAGGHVARAEDWPWSSTRALLGMGEDGITCAAPV